MLLSAAGARHQTLLHYDEARTGTISVLENRVNGERQLWINAVNEVTTRLVHDQSFKVLGHLGPLLHERPRTGVMICLGAGLSAGAAARHPLERLDVVDLSPAVAGGARWFAAENNGVLDDPIFHLHIGDGRQFLLNTTDRYDLAMIDSTHPKAVDSWILYTREFYDLVRDRLGDGGIAVQWLPLHGLSEREFQIIVRTFQSAFPEMTLWANVGFETYGHVGYAKLVGVKDGPLVIDYERLAERLADPRIQGDLAPFGMASPAEILDLFVGGPAAVARWTEGLPVQTDDHPRVPYTTSFSRGRRMEPSLLLAAREPVLPHVRGASEDEIAEIKGAWEAQGLVVAGLLDRAIERRSGGTKLALFAAQARTTEGYYAALAERYPDDADKLFEIGTQLANLGHPERAGPIYEQALDLRPDDFRTAMNLSLLRARLGEPERAIEGLVRLRAWRPRSALVHANLGAVVLGAGDPGAAAAHLKVALAADPGSLGARLSLGEAYLAGGDLDRAEEALTEVIAASRWVAEAHHLLGLLAAGRGDLDRAVARHREAATLHPYRAAFHHHLGLALHAKGGLDKAAGAFEAALSVDPLHVASIDALGRVRAAAGRFEEATDLHLRALELDPEGAEAAYHLGVALRGLERTSEAVGAFCLALRLGAGAARVRRELSELGGAVGQCGD
jgi:tetratricopeptide (TPR) repeat protein/spermidine synthase